MASVETRDVVKQYELQCNALLTSLRPGGSLSSIEVRSPCEALLVPRQISLEAIHIVPFLQARLQRARPATPHSPPPPLSDLFGEGHDTPKREEANHANTNAKEASIETDAPSSPSGLYYSPENEGPFRAALTSFLEYHLLHFDAFGNSEFTTLRGQRGAFSEDLDHVKRFGHIGQVAVLVDADPLQHHEALFNSGGTQAKRSPSPFGGQSTEEKCYHPASLQIFIIDRPLMDSTEARYIVDTLRKLTVREATVANVTARLKALFSSPPTSPRQGPQQQRSGGATQLPLLMSSDDNAAHATAAAAPTADSPRLISPRSAAFTSPSSCQVMRAAYDSENESIAETVVIDDFAEDVPEEPDLAPYVSKYTQISEQQRRRSETSRASEEATRPPIVTGKAITANDNNKTHKSGNHVVVATSLVPCVADPNNGRGNAVAQVKAQVVATPPASREENAGTNSTSSRDRVVSVTMTASSPSAATPSDATHANVLRHEYSRECVKDYRRVVAADNDISYSIFEHLMSLRCSTPLATLMSSYVSKNQQLQQPILNNVKYNKFIGSCHALVHQIPRFAADRRQAAILYEGIERYVTSRLYHQFYNVSEAEKQQNSMLQAAFMRLENMTAEQLDALPEVERHHVWGQAMFELDGMDFFKSPREKLRCGMRACELISLAVGDILRQRRNAKHPTPAKNAVPAASSSSNVSLAFGADEFLPCFLLLVLRARPLKYVQNISYMEKFRYASLMSPEESYCFATMQSAMMFWLNCKEDGRVGSIAASPATSLLPPPAQGGGTPKRRGSASVGALINAAVPLPPAHAAPLMTEQDLLPSVRQASYTARARGLAAAATNEPPQQPVDSPAGATVMAREEAPTVLDVLFGWANRSLAPLADEIGLGGGSRKATDSASSFSPTEASSPAKAAAQGSVSPGPQGKKMKAGANHALFHPGLDVTVSPSSHGTPPTPQPVHQPDANTRALVRELLVTQRKTFEQLTLTEIEMIVEEARQMLMEKKSPPLEPEKKTIQHREESV
ncbi:hypothetical protein ABB37_03875 [Leptomonas pyrrhocoris]|uniref:VPS9 domain-containing protein n=1 Tax=Leptomonas pyrrhocoris TaxID=157538 RepID=A0A0M9G3Q2_LEPPY|nr:hypothetical protein ABB37_03875 [Leptomonas pyrrhocoris]KPA81529.1 hypothetical protein ABB37_03875 [Leptomonas pyrrhocoris]|eukprot:XP_015659968.1 hypothetical protein ABB37_03875 [Leptomonas pyrrhocoris]